MKSRQPDRQYREVRKLKKLHRMMRRGRGSMTEEDIQEVIARHMRFWESQEKNPPPDWDDIVYQSDPRRQAQASEARAKRFPPTATQEQRLFALAERLGIPTKRFQGIEYDDHFGEDGLDELFEYIGRALADMQPEFWTSSPGRPRGRQNKRLANTENKDTLRKRDYREAKRKRRRPPPGFWDNY